MYVYIDISVELAVLPAQMVQSQGRIRSQIYVESLFFLHFVLEICIDFEILSHRNIIWCGLTWLGYFDIVFHECSTSQSVVVQLMEISWSKLPLWMQPQFADLISSYDILLQ